MGCGISLLRAMFSVAARALGDAEQVDYTRTLLGPTHSVAEEPPFKRRRWFPCCRRRLQGLFSAENKAVLVPVQSTPPPFDAALLSALPEESWLNMLTHLEAVVIARLLGSSSCYAQRLSGAEVAKWCAESRQALLSRRAVRGDMPLGFGVASANWTLERVHLCEQPPRFPNIYFGFAQDLLDSRALRRLRRVARVLLRHPKLRIRIEGFADPSAPDAIGRAISQARAVEVRAALLKMLQESSCSEWNDEDACAGKRDGGISSRRSMGLGSLNMQAIRSYTIAHIGKKVQAVGRWGSRIDRNQNLEIWQVERTGTDTPRPPSDVRDAMLNEANSDEDDDHDFDIDAKRRVDFTVLGLGDEAISASLHDLQI
eukprot:gb/GFBE01023419.1/.p1 GENE.gb/GFBE01023419.1/~~gb/GFBE01023419.1/.p1  ORF type:complete len:371 (+),score=53.36 gb/GFBE01023419.1/:1-1113(+)